MTRQILLGYKQLNSSHPKIFPSLNAVYRMRHIGVTNAKGEKLKWHKIGGRYFLDQSELDEWLAGTEFAPGTKLIHGDKTMPDNSEPPLLAAVDADHPDPDTKVKGLARELIVATSYAPKSVKERLRFAAKHVSPEEVSNIAKIYLEHVLAVV